jgi:hypothetical protein
MGASLPRPGRARRPLILVLVALAAAMALFVQRPLGASPMLFPRSQQSAVRLRDGRVLVVGGSIATGAEIYDPATDRWSLAEAMRVQRQGQAAALLADGRVLVAGGNALSTAVEIYDPAADRWTLAAPLNVERGSVAMTTLADGRVALLGGSSADARIEIYDPVANSWSFGAPAPVGLIYNTGTALTMQEGRVFFIAGLTGAGSSLFALYNPATDRWSATPLEGAIPIRATLLSDGRVLIVGFAPAGLAPLAFRYNPVDATLQGAAAPPCALAPATLTTLTDGRVLALGTESSGPSTCSAVYDPARNRWARARPLAQQRTSFTATELADGSVLVAGTVYSNTGYGIGVGISERYDGVGAALDESTYLPLVEQLNPYPAPPPFTQPTPVR